MDQEGVLPVYLVAVFHSSWSAGFHWRNNERSILLIFACRSFEVVTFGVADEQIEFVLLKSKMHRTP